MSSTIVRYGGNPEVSAFHQYGIFLGEAQLSANIIGALNRFVSYLKENNIWNNFDVIYPIVGGTSVWHSLNLKNPLLYRMIQNGTIVNDSNGTQGNGINGYWDTGYDWGQPNGGFFSHYSRTDVDSLSTTGFSDYGYADGGISYVTNSFYDGNAFYCYGGPDANLNGVDVRGNSLGFYTMGLADDGGGVFGYTHAYKNGTLGGISIGNANLNNPPIGHTVQWMYDGNNFSPRQYSFFAIGNNLGSMLDEDAMLAMELARYIAISNLQSALGRQI